MDKMEKARVALTLDHPFFGSLALRLRLIRDPQCPTAYTDGVVIGYSPEFTDGLTTNELKGLLAHEVMHVALAHHLRRGERKPRRWNVAGDYAINDILIESGLVLPAGGLSGMGTGRSADEIYQCLSGDGKEAPPWGEVRDYPGKDGRDASPAEVAQALQEVRIMVSQAATQAESMGGLPGCIERMVKEITHPRVDWREILRRFMQRFACNDYAWTPPNRRYIHQGLYLPSLVSDGIAGGVIAVDTSGSVGNDEVAQFASEISAILEAVSSEVTVIYCDTRIRQVETFCQQDMPIKINPKGGGGTDFRPPFEWIAEQGMKPAYLIYLTDLRCSRFPDKPNFSVLWAHIGRQGRQPPFGEIISVSG